MQKWFPEKLAAKGRGSVDVQNYDRLVRAYQDLKKPKKLVELFQATYGETDCMKTGAQESPYTNLMSGSSGSTGSSRTSQSLFAKRKPSAPAFNTDWNSAGAP
jgi:hypothetical protein